LKFFKGKIAKFLKEKFMKLSFFIFLFLATGIYPILAAQITNREPLPDGYKICVWGDSGVDTDDQYRVAKALYNEGCDEMRVVGDIIYEKGLKDENDPQFMSKFYKPYKSIITEQKIPFYMIMGNHDYYGNPKAWLELAKMHSFIKLPSFYSAELAGDICFINLDTNDNFPEQVTWLKDTVNPMFKDKCKLSMVFGHHPYLSSGSHGNAGGKLKKFYDGNIVGKYDVFMTGHDHQLSDEGKVKNTTLLISGAAGKLRKVGEPIVWGVSKFGYLVVTIKRNNNSVTALYDFITLNKDGNGESAHSDSILSNGIR
jgi:tartrate-resistant acid phosphatase type 5